MWASVDQVFRPKRNPLKTVNSPCEGDNAVVHSLVDRIDLVESPTTSTRCLQRLASHALDLVDTGGAWRVSLSKWEESGQRSSALVAKKSSSRPARTANGVNRVVESITWRSAKSDGSARTFASAPDAALGSHTRRHSQCPLRKGNSTLNYGMKEKKLASDLGISEAEAVALIKKYMDRYPAVKKFYKESVENVRRHGYAFTLLGRRRYFPEILSNRDFERWRAERQATNLEIQGTGADVMKLAMLHIDASGIDKRFGCHMCLQVHDEIVFRAQKDYLREAMDEIREYMEHPLPTELAVPLIVSMDAAPNWAAAKG